METVAQHVAIIMDGNGRWAKARKLPRSFGHREGARTARNVVLWSLERGVKQLTLFAFGQENWHRPSSEVQGLMKLLERALDQERHFLLQHQVRLDIVGDIASLAPPLRKKIDAICRATRHHQQLSLTIALSYSGQWHISEVVKTCIESGQSFADTKQVQAYLDEKLMVGVQPPDVFIRTGGDCRISNFMLWQMAYTELFFLPMYWPDLTQEDFFGVLDAYAKRQRRFGRVEEEVPYE